MLLGGGEGVHFVNLMIVHEVKIRTSSNWEKICISTVFLVQTFHFFSNLKAICMIRTCFFFGCREMMVSKLIFPSSAKNLLWISKKIIEVFQHYSRLTKEKIRGQGWFWNELWSFFMYSSITSPLRYFFSKFHKNIV